MILDLKWFKNIQGLYCTVWTELVLNDGVLATNVYYSLASSVSSCMDAFVGKKTRLQCDLNVLRYPA